MASQKKTPGVYVQELSAFPNSVVEVETAVPVFIGLTEKAKRGQTDLTAKPTRIASMTQYEALFGLAPETKLIFAGSYAPDGFAVVEDIPKGQAHARLYLYYALQMFYANGGGPCFIMSVGQYEDTPKLQNEILGALPLLELEQEPTLVVIPDAVSLTSDGWQEVSNATLLHCQKMQSRFAILDVYQGDASEQDANVISNFRNAISNIGLDYGAAYYPWICTSVLSDGDIDPSFLSDAALKSLVDGLTTVAGGPAFQSKQKQLLDLIAIIGAGKTQPPAPAIIPAAPPVPGAPPAPPPPPAPKRMTADEYTTQYQRAHDALSTAMPAYKDVMTAIREALNLMPPSGGMAGVYARIDSLRGVFKAPAGTGMIGAVRPAVNITNETQQDMNVPLDGKAINAIRSFPGNGILVWGARTLEGNSQDFRYINVRRTLIMLEQSIAIAAQAYVFEPNNSSTWTNVRGTIENFLTNQWKAGALVGATTDRGLRRLRRPQYDDDRERHTRRLHEHHCPCRDRQAG